MRRALFWSAKFLLGQWLLVACSAPPTIPSAPQSEEWLPQVRQTNLAAGEYENGWSRCSYGCAKLLLHESHEFEIRLGGGTTAQCLGRWSEEAGSIHLSPESGRCRDLSWGSTIIPIRCGDWLYMVPKRILPKFLADLQSSWKKPDRETAGIEAFGREVGHQVGVPKALPEPEIPKNYLDYFRSGPVSGDLTEIPFAPQLAILDQGSAERVRPGMILAPWNYEGWECDVLVAFEHFSVASVYWGKHKDGTPRHTKVSTSAVSLVLP